MNNNNRFEISKKNGMLDGVKIITGTQTGVQYLFYYAGYAGGLTTLLDKDGKPLLDSGIGENI